MIITVICTGSSAHELSQATIRIRTIYGEGEIRGKAGRRFEWDRQQENRSHKACRTHTSYNMYVYTYIYIKYGGFKVPRRNSGGYTPQKSMHLGNNWKAMGILNVADLGYVWAKEL